MRPFWMRMFFWTAVTLMVAVVPFGFGAVATGGSSAPASPASDLSPAVDSGPLIATNCTFTGSSSPVTVSVSVQTGDFLVAGAVSFEALTTISDSQDNTYTLEEHGEYGDQINTATAGTSGTDEVTTTNPNGYGVGLCVAVFVPGSAIAQGGSDSPDPTTASAISENSVALFVGAEGITGCGTVESPSWIVGCGIVDPSVNTGEVTSQNVSAGDSATLGTGDPDVGADPYDAWVEVASPTVDSGPLIETNCAFPASSSATVNVSVRAGDFLVTVAVGYYGTLTAPSDSQGNSYAFEVAGFDYKTEFASATARASGTDAVSESDTDLDYGMGLCVAVFGPGARILAAAQSFDPTTTAAVAENSTALYADIEFGDGCGTVESPLWIVGCQGFSEVTSENVSADHTATLETGNPYSSSTQYRFASWVEVGVGPAPPPAPTDLSLDSIGSGDATFNWTQSTGGGIVNNTVYLFESTDGCTQIEDPAYSTGGAATTWTITGLTTGATYSVDVTSWNATGQSPTSNCVSFVDEVEPSVSVSDITSDSFYETWSNGTWSNVSQAGLYFGFSSAGCIDDFTTTGDWEWTYAAAMGSADFAPQSGIVDYYANFTGYPTVVNETFVPGSTIWTCLGVTALASGGHSYVFYVSTPVEVTFLSAPPPAGPSLTITDITTTTFVETWSNGTWSNVSAAMLYFGFSSADCINNVTTTGYLGWTYAAAMGYVNFAPQNGIVDYYANFTDYPTVVNETFVPGSTIWTCLGVETPNGWYASTPVEITFLSAPPPAGPSLTITDITTTTFVETWSNGTWHNATFVELAFGLTRADAIANATTTFDWVWTWQVVYTTLAYIPNGSVVGYYTNETLYPAWLNETFLPGGSIWVALSVCVGESCYPFSVQEVNFTSLIPPLPTGFDIFPPIAAMIILAAIGLTGLYFYNRKSKSPYAWGGRRKAPRRSNARNTLSDVLDRIRKR